MSGAEYLDDTNRKTSFLERSAILQINWKLQHTQHAITYFKINNLNLDMTSSSYFNLIFWSLVPPLHVGFLLPGRAVVGIILETN